MVKIPTSDNGAACVNCTLRLVSPGLKIISCMSGSADQSISSNATDKSSGRCPIVAL